jgi:hypothetical protein
MKRHLQALTVFGLAGTVATMGACSKSTTDDNGTGVSSLLFIKRQAIVTNPDGTVTVDVAGGNGQVLDYQRYEPGGSLNLLSPARADGTVTNLTGDFTTADFNGADVSFDATQAVFSMKVDANDHYHIYTVQLTPGADGKFEVHQKTAGPYDDVSPIYLPGGLIAFTTNEMYTAMGTRADEYEHSREALQLATISVTGGDAQRHLFPQNLSHAVAPFLRYDGTIGFSQWEHFASTNDVKIRKVNPGGTQQLGIAGEFNGASNDQGQGKPGDALFSVKEISPNVMIGIVTARDRTIHAGALVQIDARNVSDPTCMDPANYTNGSTVGHQCLNDENVHYTVLTPNVPTGSDPSPVGRYREPNVLPNGSIITSWAEGPVNDMNEQSLTPPDFGIYIYNPSTGENQLVYNDRTTWDLNAVPVVARTEPPVVGETQQAQDSTIPIRLGSINIGQTDLNETVSGAQFDNVPMAQALAQGAVSVRVIEGFSSEAAMGVTMFGLTMFEGAAVLGEAPLFKDGSWLVTAPPYIPLHLQPIDKFGMAIRNQRLWINGTPGEDRRCVGCHESRTGAGVPTLGAQPTVAEQQCGTGEHCVAAQDFTEAIADRTEFPWNKKVQPILDANCVSCHNGATTNYYTMSRTDPVTGVQTTYKIPSLDLSSTPVTVYYDRRVASYPASYVSIFYPASLGMMGDGDTTGKVVITGAAPCATGGLPSGGLQDGTAGGCTPWWGIPGSARASAITQRINLNGILNGTADGTTAWPLATNPKHPEDVGGSLSDSDRKTIAVYPMDLGGQYWARQNTNFSPFTSGDPVTPVSN